MFRLAHLSDAHIGPLPRPRLRELMSKRLTGYMNYRQGRKRTHNMGVLERIIADMQAHKPDHVAFTGDIANIGLKSETALAFSIMQRMGAPDHVSFVPGNHDAYVRGALDHLTEQLNPWMCSDDHPASTFPYVRRRGEIALVGLSSAIPTAPFVASGTLGHEQIEKTALVLEQLKGENLCRIIMIHHPPHRAGAKAGRGLTDAGPFEDMLKAKGAELILHGHNHRRSLAFIESATGPIPILGVPSASAAKGTLTHRAAWHMISVFRDGKGFRLTGWTRGLTKAGTIEDLGEIGFDASTIRQDNSAN